VYEGPLTLREAGPGAIVITTDAPGAALPPQDRAIDRRTPL